MARDKRYIIASLLLAIVSLASLHPVHAAPTLDSRPFKVGVMRLNVDLDNSKPLGMLDHPGWTVAGSLLIGAIDRHWIGAYSVAKNSFVWWYRLDEELTSQPTALGAAIMFGMRNGHVVKVDVATGQKLWEATLDSFVQRPFVLNGGILLAQTSAQVLYALDYQSGKTEWLFDGGFPDTLSIHGTTAPVVFDNRAFMSLASGEIVAVSMAGGKILWRHNPAYNDARFHDVVGEMIVKNNRLHIARYDGIVAAIDLTGNERRSVWEDRLGSISTAVYHDGRYYLGLVNGDVYSYDMTTGRRLWRVVTGVTVQSLTIAESKMYVAGSSGRITQLNTADGSELWHDDVGGHLSDRPIILPQGIFFSTGIKNLYGYRL